MGKTGAEVTVLGLGGEGILRTTGYEGEACALEHEVSAYARRLVYYKP